MPRDLPLSNGALLVNFDRQYQLRDLYWPHVGQENHTAGHPFRFGVWVEGAFSWVSDDGWQRSLVYAPGTLQTDVTLASPSLDVTLHCQDTVDFHENLYLRQITVENDRDTPRQVRLFFAQDFHIGGTEVGDSAYYEPERLAVFHYKGRRWFVINTARESTEGWQLGVDQWAVGNKETAGFAGAWQDAQDGELSGNAVAQGSIDSCVALHLLLPAHGQATGWYWIGVGEDFPEVTRINRMVRQKGPAAFMKRTKYYWSLWLTKSTPQPTGAEADTLFQRSLLTMRTQIDNGGSIIAATDYDIVHEARDTYCYMWPRDGALVAASLIDAGYANATGRFFDFCHRIITEEGYFLHKYNPDGSLASSWIGWYYHGQKELPVQEDETALILWALWRHFTRFHDVEFIKPLFRGLIIRAANWIAGFRDESSGLPRPSWDLWEERRGIHAWTVGAVWGGLHAAASFAEAFGEMDLATLYRSTATALKAAMDHHGWDANAGRFARLLYRDEAGAYHRDLRHDASIAGLWLFGMYVPNDPRIAATMRALHRRLWVQTPIGGIARYEDDLYHRAGGDPAQVPGNPWFICTLWLARWYAETAKTPEEMAQARQLLAWAQSHAMPSGTMPEQINPFSGEALSVSPLTWSHAEYVNALRAISRE